MREKPPPRYFEVRPASGRLMPGEAKNIWVRFVPSEEVRVLGVRTLGGGQGTGLKELGKVYGRG